MAFLKGLPWQLWAGLGIMALGLFWGHLRFNAGQTEGLAERDKVQAKYDAHLRADTDALDEAKREARAAESAQKQAMADAKATYAKDKQHALDAKDLVIADLRSGARRLQDKWRGCESGPKTAGGGQGSDGLADLRAESAGRIVRYAAEADAQVTYLQGLIRSAPACFRIEP
jgi:hypothetical protein